MRAPALRPGAAGATARRPAHVSLSQAAARRTHRAAPHAAGTDRASSRADPAPAHPPPPLPRGAPNSPQRAQVTALARPATPIPPPPPPAGDPAQHAQHSPARLLWARVLARLSCSLPVAIPPVWRADSHHRFHHRQPHRAGLQAGSPALPRPPARPAHPALSLPATRDTVGCPILSGPC